MTSRFLTAFKIALSMAIVYAISLSMDWDSPHWAAFSVAFCSLATVGESLLKGLLRTFGTFTAIFVAITLLALFPQDRWIFAFCVSLWVAFCTWKMYGNPRWYYWFCAGLGVPLLAMMSGGESLMAFETMVLRAQQTVLGTLVFTVVSSLLFPSNTRGSLENDVLLQLEDAHTALSTGRAVLMAIGRDQEQPDIPGTVLKQAALRQAGLQSKLQAAALDSFDVAETKHAWRNAIDAMASIVDTLERLRLGLADLEGGKPSEQLVGLEFALEEMLRRLRAASDVLSGQDLDDLPRPIQIDLPRAETEKLPAFQRAALSQTCGRLRELDHHSEKLLIAIADVRGVRNAPVTRERSSQMPVYMPDPERVYGTLRVFTAFWMTFLAYVYVPELPSWVVLIAMTTAIAMLMMMAPAMPLRGFVTPVMLSVLTAGAIHMLIMPKLSGFATLGLVIFSATFMICWICHTPQQGMGRALGLAFFAVLVQIENTPTYSFTFIANVTVAFGLVLSVLVAVSYFPVSFQPERVLLRLIRRYFRAMAVLLETLHIEKRPANSWFERQRRAYYARQMHIIPGKMTMWIKALPSGKASAQERDSLTALAAGLAMLSDRTRDLLATRDHEHSDAWVRELVDETRAWRHAMQELCDLLGAARPDDISAAELRTRLANRMNSMEALIADAIAQGRTEEVDDMKNEMLFHELGGFRGVSANLIALVEQVKQIDWGRLREERL